MRCCANYTVSIVGYDAWLIATRLRLPPESFLVFFPVAAEDEKGFLLEPGGQRYEVALDKVGEFQKGNPCIFWIDLMNGRGRCGIYPIRPYVCQSYPAYQQEETVLLREDVLCPEGSWNLAGMDLSRFRRGLFRFRMEQDIYAYIVAAWNRQVERQGVPRRLADYYAHLLEVYGRIEQVRRRLDAARLAELEQRWGARSASAPNPLFVDLLPLPDEEPWAAILAELRSAVDGSPPSRPRLPELVAA
jgi:Fe-S-cluster containining protein